MWFILGAAAQTLVLDGAVSDDGRDFERVPFEVPNGIVEIEVRHTSLTPGNTLDWGLEDPSGAVRGWGGGNAEPAIVGEAAASRSYRPGPITPGRWTVLVGKPDIDTPPLDYALEVEMRAEATLSPRPGRQPYLPAPPLELEARWYAGDFHVHSLESGDGAASLDAIAELARAQGLDFVAISDHNTGSSWDFLTSAQQRHPDVLFVPAMEFTTYAGHANAIGSTVPLDFRLGLTDTSVASVSQAVQQDGGIFSINHPTLDLGDFCLGCAWEHDLDWEDVQAIEIVTGGLLPVGSLFLEDTLLLWEEALASGHRIAAIGGSDDHKAGVDLGFQQSPIGSPTTLVYAEVLSVAGLTEGIRRGRTVVKLQGPMDPMLELAPSGATVTVRVTGGEDHGLVVFVDGEPRPEVRVDSAEFEHALPALPGARVRAELHRDAQRRVIASPVYLPQESPASERRCGCHTVSWTGGFWLWMVWVFVEATRERMRRRRALSQ